MSGARPGESGLGTPVAKDTYLHRTPTFFTGPLTKGAEYAVLADTRPNYENGDNSP